METIYSKEKFEGYTHRFIVQFKTDNSSHDLTLYSNSDSNEELEEFINKKKSERVVSFRIEHKASKEEDEWTGELLEEILK